MKSYLGITVLEAAKRRIARLFDEFDHITVGYSGGKDSTIVLHLALEEARRRDRLPLPVMFLDQEAEFTTTIDIVRKVMYMPEVKPEWLQIPIRLTNATSGADDYLWCWKPEEEALWLRPKDPISLKENIYGTDRFHPFFAKYFETLYSGKRAIYIAGMRAEESPARFAATTTSLTYKDITWGLRLSKTEEHYTFYPIYDWTLQDVWKAIHDHGWPYCGLYDVLYSIGVPPARMRVSNVHHETALKSMEYLQQIDPTLYDALTRRLSGIDAAGKAEKDYFVKEFPYMFASWIEYREHLLANIIPEDKRPIFRRRFDLLDRNYKQMNAKGWKDLGRLMCNSLIANDVDLTKLTAWNNAHPAAVAFRHWKRGLPVKIKTYIPA